MSDAALKDIELSAPQAELLSSMEEMNLFLAGQGSGKTHIMGVISGLLVQTLPHGIGMIDANTYGQLSDSTLVRIFEVWKDYFGWKEYNKATDEGFYIIDKQPPESFTPHGLTFKSNANKIFFRNGHVIMCGSLDAYKSLDGREVHYALLDETKDTKEDAFKDVIHARCRRPGLSVRKSYRFDRHFFPLVPSDHTKALRSINPIYVFTSPAKVPWLTETFKLEDFREEIEATIFDKEDYFVTKHEGRCTVICSTYHNQKNLPENYIANRVGALSKDRVDMLVYGSPFSKEGVEYYANFKRSEHVAPNLIDPDLPLHITFDFNVNPYMTLLVSQVVPSGMRQKWRIIDEICLESPRNSIEAVCREFINEYSHLCTAGFYYYGDASGKNTLPIEELRNYYKLIERELYEVIGPKSRRLLRKNPNHRAVGRKTMGRRDFMNKLLSGAMGVDLEVDPKCKKTIADFELVREDANGAKEKKKVKINGVMAEKYGHTSDAADSMAAYLWGDYR